jgi:hypothetical protein
VSSSDLAALSSISAQLDELRSRITAMAERYGTTPDSAIAADLYSVERALLTAARAIQRASANLDATRP